MSTLFILCNMTNDYSIIIIHMFLYLSQLKLVLFSSFYFFPLIIITWAFMLRTFKLIRSSFSWKQNVLIWSHILGIVDNYKTFKGDKYNFIVQNYLETVRMMFLQLYLATLEFKWNFAECSKLGKQWLFEMYTNLHFQ